MEDAVYDRDFTAVKNYDSMKNFAHVEELSTETYVKGLFLTSKKNFIIGHVDVNKDCNFGPHIFWFNEKNIPSLNSNRHDGYCLTGINGIDFISDYKVYLSNEIESGLKDFFDENEINYNLDVSIDKISGEIKVIIKTVSSKDTMLNSIKLEREYVLTSDVGVYGELVTEINSALPLFSKKIKDEIVGCKNKLSSAGVVSNDIELDCMKTTFNSMIKSEVLNKYDLEVNRVDGFVQEGFYALNFIFKKRGSDLVELEFAGVFEDNVPLGLVEYSLSPRANNENVVNVEIKKSKANVDAISYVILYSYSEFLDKKYVGYDRLMYLLENSKLPDDLIKISASSDDQYYHTPKNSNLDLSVIVTSANSSFDVNDKKKVMLYQIFNKDTGNYELLSKGKKLNVLVFAVDSKFNYYTENGLLNQNLKDIRVDSSLGLKPLQFPQNIKVENNLPGFEKSINYSVVKYDSLGFEGYQLYVKEKDTNQKFTKDCVGLTNCYFSSQISLSNPNGNFLITSDTSLGFEVEAKYDHVFRLNNLELEDSKEYEFLMIPIDSNGVGVFDSYDKEYEFISKVSGGTTHFVKQKSNLPIIVSSVNLVIKDQKAPKLNDVLITGFTDDGTNIYFNWNSKPGLDINSIRIKGSITSNGQTNEFSKEIKSDKIVASFLTTTGIQITHIFPVDSAGNFIDSTLVESDYGSAFSWP